MLNGAKLQQLFAGDTENKTALGVVMILCLLLSVTVIWQISDLWDFATLLRGQTSDLSNRHLNSNLATHTEVAKGLFGQSKSQVKERVNTKYSLLGILMSSDPKKSKAIIQLPGQEAKIYTVGEQINGLKLKMVKADRVILSGYDTDESLYISWNKSGENSTTPGILDENVVPNPAVNNASEADTEPANNQAQQSIVENIQNVTNNGSAPIDEGQIAKIRERINQLRQKGVLGGFRFGGGR